MSIHHEGTSRRNLSAQSSDFSGFLVHALMTWRIMSFLTFRSGLHPAEHWYEDGPYKIFEHWRKFIGIQYAEDGSAWQHSQTNEVAKAFTCAWCASIWVGFAVALLTGHSLGYGLALSSAAMAFEKWMRKA